MYFLVAAGSLAFSLPSLDLARFSASPLLCLSQVALHFTERAIASIKGPISPRKRSNAAITPDHPPPFLPLLGIAHKFRSPSVIYFVQLSFWFNALVLVIEAAEGLFFFLPILTLVRVRPSPGLWRNALASSYPKTTPYVGDADLLAPRLKYCACSFSLGRLFFAKQGRPFSFFFKFGRARPDF